MPLKRWLKDTINGQLRRTGFLLASTRTVDSLLQRNAELENAAAHPVVTVVERERDLTLDRSHAARERIVALGKLLAVRAPAARSMTRIGGPNDGGYVVVDDIERIGTVISLGIGNEVSFDLALAERGIAVHQFDHTVDGPPISHPMFEFNKVKVSAAPAADSLTIEQIASSCCSNGERLLKIDVEGDEWPVLRAASPQTLASFAQIVVEFHWFHKCIDADWYEQAREALERITESFDAVHVHANNCAPLLAIGNVPFPDVLEVTFARRSDYPSAPAEGMFPTALDSPNDARYPDHFLGSFRFP